MQAMNKSTILRAHEKRHYKLLDTFPNHHVNSFPLATYAAPSNAVTVTIDTQTGPGISSKQSNNLFMAWGLALGGAAYLVSCNVSNNNVSQTYGAKPTSPLGSPVTVMKAKAVPNAMGGAGGMGLARVGMVAGGGVEARGVAVPRVARGLLALVKLVK